MDINELETPKTILYVKENFTKEEIERLQKVLKLHKIELLRQVGKMVETRSAALKQAATVHHEESKRLNSHLEYEWTNVFHKQLNLLDT